MRRERKHERLTGPAKHIPLKAKGGARGKENTITIATDLKQKKG